MYDQLKSWLPLNANNPLYKEVQINSDWLDEANRMMLTSGKHCQHNTVHHHYQNRVGPILEKNIPTKKTVNYAHNLCNECLKTTQTQFHT